MILIRAGAVLAALVAAVVGMCIGVAIAIVVGGAASGWHPDVGGALFIGILSLLLGTGGLAMGLSIGVRLYDRAFQGKAPSNGVRR